MVEERWLNLAHHTNESCKLPMITNTVMLLKCQLQIFQMHDPSLVLNDHEWVLKSGLLS